MARILFVGRILRPDERIRFLLGLAGFELVQVRNIEEAINLIEINESFDLVFNLLLVSMATLLNNHRRYTDLLTRTAKKIPIMVVVTAEEMGRLRVEFEEIFTSQGMVVVSEEKVLSEIQGFFTRDESVGIATSSCKGGEHGAQHQQDTR